MMEVHNHLYVSEDGTVVVARPGSDPQEVLNIALAAPTPEQLTSEAWTALRTERDRLLAESDKAVMPFVERGEPAPPEWQVYRQALRDLPENIEDPKQVEWPKYE